MIPPAGFLADDFKARFAVRKCCIVQHIVEMVYNGMIRPGPCRMLVVGDS